MLDRTVASNTTPILSLLKIGRLDLLPSIYGKIVIAEAVFFELEAGKDKPFYVDFSKLEWLEIQKSAFNSSPFLTNLDAGEAASIALAIEQKVDLLIIDEKAGRNAAQSLGLKITGTLGVLLRAKKMGLVEQIRPLLADLKNAGIWIGIEREKEVLRLAGE